MWKSCNKLFLGIRMYLACQSMLWWKCWYFLFVMSFWKVRSHSIIRTLKFVRIRILKNGRIGKWSLWKTNSWWTLWKEKKKKYKCFSSSFCDYLQSMRIFFQTTREICFTRNYSKEHIILSQPELLDGHCLQYHSFRWLTVWTMEITT